MEKAILVGVEFTSGATSGRISSLAGARAGTGIRPRRAPGACVSAPAGSAPEPERARGREPGRLDDSLAELRELATSAGAEIVATCAQRRPRADSATLIGAGKVGALARTAAATGADLVLFDQELSATQQRNLERGLGTRVLARTQLILDIFARHARTREGQLQVELAQLEYLLPRLAGHGRALSRLGGGIGTRGPGETQLETDRRRIHHRIRHLRLALERVRSQRGEQRRQRESVPLATVALVGYTNAGKSTLFNRLTGAGVLTSSRMFATLDPTLRGLCLPSRRRVLLSDTVGFLRHLPHGLISAFRATLEEVTRASLLLEVRDVQAARRDEQAAETDQVLAELGVRATPRILVWNKADLLASTERDEAAPAPSANSADGSAPLLVSARTGLGIEALLAEIDRKLDQATPRERIEEVRLRIPHPAGKILHLLHERGQIVLQDHTGEQIEMLVRVPASLLPKIRDFRVSGSAGFAPGGVRGKTVENP